MRKNTFAVIRELTYYLFDGKLSFSLKLFSGHFYGQFFIKTVRRPLVVRYENYLISIIFMNIKEKFRNER